MNVFDNYFSGRIAMTFTLPMTSQQVQRIAPMKRTSSILPREDSENLNILKTTYCRGFCPGNCWLGLLSSGRQCSLSQFLEQGLQAQRQEGKIQAFL